MERNLFNIDLVNAKSGKKLSKSEKALQYVVNLVATRLFQALMFVAPILLGFIILKFLYLILIA
jgi:hypothetical protein